MPKIKTRTIMLYIANPIYDSVFKYLMADERIARTILSALLKMNITKIEMRAHEYPNIQRESLSVFRLDFSATVREDDGSTHIVLIELQKTWLETETLRFRQYLGVQYQSPANMGDDGYGVPMIAVYLLGHRVGDIEEPVIYVHNEVRNSDGQVVEKGIPDPFVSSLTHESVIVQIPLLRGQVNTKLDRVLSIFDQTRKADVPGTEHTLCIDEGIYSDDADMGRILHRLLAAASEPSIRQEMNVEDEYFSIIEKRDTEILIKDRQLAEKNVKLAERDKQLAEKSVKLAEQDKQLAEQDVIIAEQNEQLQQKDSLLRKSVLALKATMPADQIAATLGITTDEVERLSK